MTMYWVYWDTTITTAWQQLSNSLHQTIIRPATAAAAAITVQRFYRGNVRVISCAVIEYSSQFIIS